MKKSIVFTALIFLGVFSEAVAQKIGHVNVNELIMSMPETKKAQEKLQKLQDSLYVANAEMMKEYQEKDSVIRADSSKWTPAKKDIKFKEFRDLAEALQNYSSGAQQYIQQKEQELIEPIQKIAREAVNKVAKEAGYQYVFTSEALIVAPPGDDLLARVKAHLKIADKPTGTQK
jgi:outer membrane protein